MSTWKKLAAGIFGEKKTKGPQREIITDEMRKTHESIGVPEAEGYRTPSDRRIDDQVEMLERSGKVASEYFDDALDNLDTSAIIEGYLMQKYVDEDIVEFFEANGFTAEDTAEVKKILEEEKGRIISTAKNQFDVSKAEATIMNDFAIAVEDAMRTRMEERQASEIRKVIKVDFKKSA